MIRNRIVLIAMVLTALVAVAAVGCAPHPPTEASDKTNITFVLYFSTSDGESLVAEERTVERGDMSMSEQALMELVLGPREEGHLRTLPEESIILAVEVRDDTAFVDLGRETVEHHSGGSLGDMMSVTSIVHTLTELPGIRAVQLLLEGEIVEAVFGHIATDKPLTR